MAASSGLFLATIYNQSQLAERKHVACYWLINTAATAVPLSAHPSPYNEISGGHIWRGVVWRRCSAGPVLPLWTDCALGQLCQRRNSKSISSDVS